jgi:hypothetical protein
MQQDKHATKSRFEAYLGYCTYCTVTGVHQMCTDWPRPAAGRGRDTNAGRIGPSPRRVGEGMRRVGEGMTDFLDSSVM